MKRKSFICLALLFLLVTFQSAFASEYAMKAVKRYFRSHDIKFTTADDENAIITSWTYTPEGYGKKSMEIAIFFDKDDEGAGLRCFNFYDYPESKTLTMVAATAAFNDKYRWVKFTIDTKDNSVTLAADVPFREGTEGTIVLEMVRRMVNIAEDCYPAMVKAQKEKL